MLISLVGKKKLACFFWIIFLFLALVFLPSSITISSANVIQTNFSFFVDLNRFLVWTFGLWTSFILHFMPWVLLAFCYFTIQSTIFIFWMLDPHHSAYCVPFAAAALLKKQRTVSCKIWPTVLFDAVAGWARCRHVWPWRMTAVPFWNNSSTFFSAYISNICLL